MAAATATRAQTSIPKVKAAYETLADSLKQFTSPKKVDMHVRRAVDAGNLDAVLRCVQRPQRSKITFKTPGVMKHTLQGLRLYPQREQWDENSVIMALRRSKAIATLLDSETSGFGKNVTQDDPRQSPHLLGTYLELVAIDATKYKKETVDDVKTAADRLLSVLADKPELKQTTWEVPEWGRGPVDVVLNNLPVLNGLVLAQKLLGKSMPRAGLANEIVASYDAGIRSVIETIKAQNLKEGSYAHGAVLAWESRVQG